MAKRKAPETGDYKHPSSKRSNLPTEQTEALMSEEEREPVPYTPPPRVPDEDTEDLVPKHAVSEGAKPRLAWQRGQSPNQKVLLATPLFVKEKVKPGVFARWLQDSRSHHQMDMFQDFNGLPYEDAKYEWYQHKGNWNNRLIHGESAQVMTSLIKQEGMEGRVQMIYFDPPYGINYKGNFQPSTKSLDTKDGQTGLPNDVRTIRAYRDTWENGIHSYLDQMLEKITLAHQLLTDSGSMFVQIGDDNVGRMMLVMDEVFGAENRVALIPFVTTGGSSAKTLPSVADFLLWYAKDKELVKYLPLYKRETDDQKLSGGSAGRAGVEFPDGTQRYLKNEERKAENRIGFPESAKIFALINATSMGHSDTGRSEPYQPKEEALARLAEERSIACPKGRQWRVSHEGLDRLAEKNRLFLSVDGDKIFWKWYLDEIPGNRFHNVWSDRSNERSKRYVVQTAEKIIQRCVLMSTDPGDLVFDPTCGSGTTAAVAEQWGRRWITCDTSPTTLAITRQRIIARAYDYWDLLDSSTGHQAELELAKRVGCPPQVAERATKQFGTDPANGFVYERVPFVSARTLAYDLPTKATYLVDRPLKAKGKVRVASPFTVESLTAPALQPFSDSDRADSSAGVTDERNRAFLERVVGWLEKNGATDPTGNSKLNVVEIEPLEGAPPLTHTLTYWEGRRKIKAGALIVPEDVAVGRHTIRRAARAVAEHLQTEETLAVVAFESEMGSQLLDGEADQVGRVKVVHLRPHRDLPITELKDDPKHAAFTILGEPDVQVSWAVKDGKVNKKEVVVELAGYDTFDPSSGETKHGKPEDVAVWMVDYDFNGEDFFARRLHFPNGKNDMKKLARALKVDENSPRFQASLSTKSAPMPLPSEGNGMAVRVITHTGDEMTIEIPDPAALAQASSS